MIWDNVSIFRTNCAILTSYICANPRTCRGFSRRCCHVAESNVESFFLSEHSHYLQYYDNYVKIQILIHFLQSQRANKSVKLITYDYYLTNNTILYVTFIPKAIEGYKRSDSLKRIATAYTGKIVPHFSLN